MRLRVALIAVLGVSAACGASATEQWRHFAVCANVVKGPASPAQFPGATARESAMEWMGRNGWELAAIEKDHCVDPSKSTRQNLVYQDVFWFKSRIDPQTPMSAAPAASGAR